MKTKTRKTITPASTRRVIALFKHSKENSSTKIAELSGLSVKTVNTILDKYLNKKVKIYQNKNGR